MKKSLILFAVLSLTFFNSCDEGTINNIINSTSLTDEEIAEGLKEALIVGTDTSVSIVSALDGYYKDEIIKIFLPPEADIIVDNKDNALLQAIGINALIDDMVLKLNRAAEDAAIEAKDIFVNSITSMTIIDAVDLLYGEDTAATHFLRITTSDALKSAFKPKITTSLNKPIVGGVSTNDTWESFTGKYNDVANTLAGKLAGLTPVETELDSYVTWKALEGLFYKLSLEERDIRTDPLARVNDILQKVFGELDK